MAKVMNEIPAATDTQGKLQALEAARLQIENNSGKAL